MDPLEQPKTISLNRLTLTVYEPLEDYVFLAPVPPFKADEYITHLAGIKLGFGARFYLLKALTKVRKMFPDGNIPLWAFEVDKVPQMDRPITRRRGSWLVETFEIQDISLLNKNDPISKRKKLSLSAPEIPQNITTLDVSTPAPGQKGLGDPTGGNSEAPMT